MNCKAEALLNSIRPDICLCFDAEFARGMEMLELSAVNMRSSVVYQQRFKPRRYRTWDSDIHHITPAMVATAPSFSSCRRRIQAMIDNCSYIVGFAVRENDISKMKRQYVQGLDSKHVIELREWFWICHGREHGLDYQQGISLKTCCEHLGVCYDEEQAHSSAFDALVTLECFKILFDRFVDRYDSERQYHSFADVYAHFVSVFRKHKHEYDLERASGFCSIIRAGKDFMVKATRDFPTETEFLVECIEVADRKKALMRIGEKFVGEPRSRSFFFRRLTDSNLEFFRRQAKSRTQNKAVTQK